MHDLIPEGEQRNLRQGRLLATQAAVLAKFDLVEATGAMARAVRLAPNDALTVRLAKDLEEQTSAEINTLVGRGSTNFK